MNPNRSRKNPRTLLVEVGIFALVFLYYEAGNFLFEVDDDPTRAHENALKLWEFEKQVGIAFEKPAQDFFQPHPWAMAAFVFFYSGPHFALSLGFLAWVYWRRFEAFAYVRNTALIVTVTAFAFEWAFPVAPPRLVPEFAMADTVKEWLSVNNSTPWITAMVNDYAGFPSIHTSWSLLVAVLAIELTTSRWRWLWLLYPSTIALSITATANHVTWDVVGAVAWVTGCQVVHHALIARGSLPHHRFLPRPAAAPVPVDEAD